jgi:hypothetical protein
MNSDPVPRGKSAARGVEQLTYVATSEPGARGGSQPHRNPQPMCAITASPNCEHLTSFAPSMRRAKS